MKHSWMALLQSAHTATLLTLTKQHKTIILIDRNGKSMWRERENSERAEQKMHQRII